MARRGLFVAAVGLALLASLGLFRLEVDNRVAHFFPDAPEARAVAAEHAADFDARPVVRVALRGAAVWTEAGVGAWLGLDERLRDVEGVSRVVPPTAGLTPSPDAEVLRTAIGSSPLPVALGTTIADGTVLTWLVEIDERVPTAAVVERLERVAVSLPSELGATVAGLPSLDRAFDQSTREVGRVVVPAVVAVVAIGLLVGFRTARTVGILLAFVGSSLAVVFGLLGWARVAIDLVLVVLAPLVVVIATATAVHVVLAFRRALAAGLDRGAAAERAVERTRWAVVWAGVTTGVGFASFAVSGVGPVRTMGLAACAALGVVTVGCLLVLPVLLRYGESGAALAAGGDLGRRLAGWAVRRRRLVVATGVVVAAVAAFGWPRLTVETNALTYLAPDHPARQAIERLEADGVGVATIEIGLGPSGCRGGDGPFERREGVETLARVTSAVRTVPGVLHAVSWADVGAAADDMRGSAAVTGLGELLAARRSLLTADGCRARVAAWVRMIGVKEADRMRRALEAVASSEASGLDVAITGDLLLVLETQRRLVWAFGSSLALSATVIGVLVLVLVGRVRLAALVAFPNLLPVVVVLGVMGWAGVPLDIASVMVAAVALGLSVDDSLHTLGYYRRSSTSSAGEAAVEALAKTVPAYMLTGTVLVAGFATCTLSSFAPTARFGGLLAVAIAVAVASDVLLLPALLSFDRRPAVEHG